MEVGVLNINGQETGRKATLDETIFGIEPNDHVLYFDVKRCLTSQRQGIAKSKERNELSGSTRKLGRQRGGGGARRGDINSPLLVDGTRVSDPKPHDYRFRLDKKAKNPTCRSALLYKVQENTIVVMEDFTLDAPKTKNSINIAKSPKIESKKSLLILPEVGKNVYLPAHNLRQADVVTASTLNTYKILNANVLVVTENSLKVIDNVLIR